MPNIDLKNHPQIFQDRPQQIWVSVPKPGTSGGKLPVLAHSTEEAAALSYHNSRSQYHSPEEATLHRPSLQPIYGGPTLLEALWAEMDRLMAGLMTGQDAEDICGSTHCDSYDVKTGRCSHIDSGDKYRAQELAWVLAIVTNAYAPSVDAVRAEALRRWNEEVAAEDQDDMNTRPQGADQ